MRPAPPQQAFVRAMLRRVADAGELGVERRFIPQRVLDELARAGLVKDEAIVKATAAGRAAIEERDN